MVMTQLNSSVQVQATTATTKIAIGSWPVWKKELWSASIMNLKQSKICLAGSQLGEHNFSLHTWSSAVQTSWVGVPLTITPTHCGHLSFWHKAWVAIKHHHRTFCCVGVRLQEATDWRDWGSTVSWMREVKCGKIGATCILITAEFAEWQVDPLSWCLL